MDMFTFCSLVSNISSLITWMQEKKLLALIRICEKCDNQCRIRCDKEAVDGLIFRCPDSKCRKKFSIRSKSFFEGSHLSLKEILAIIYLWANKIPIVTAKKLLTGLISNDRSYTSWFNFCRDICTKHLLASPILLGGEDRIVEIDETHFGAKRKYNRGRCNPGIDVWVFGILDRTTKQVVMWMVDDRKRATLQPLIQQHILPGSTIHSDTWRPYFNLGALGYTHHMVNHSEEFVREDGMHTNGIECEWGVVKAELKIMRGLNMEQLPLFLDEHMYRKRYLGQDIFMKLLEHIAIFHPVNDLP